MYRWAVSMQLLLAAMIQALSSVPPMQRGRCAARESPGVHPVNWKDVDATLPHHPPPVSAMVQVMRYSNARAQPAFQLRINTVCILSESRLRFSI